MYYLGNKKFILTWDQKRKGKQIWPKQKLNPETKDLSYDKPINWLIASEPWLIHNLCLFLNREILCINSCIENRTFLNPSGSHSVVAVAGPLELLGMKDSKRLNGRVMGCQGRRGVVYVFTVDIRSFESYRSLCLFVPTTSATSCETGFNIFTIHENLTKVHSLHSKCKHLPKVIDSRQWFDQRAKHAKAYSHLHGKSLFSCSMFTEIR